MKITVSTEEARKCFFPTPPALARKLLEDIDWLKIRTVLEPSVGKGNLLTAIGRELAEYRHSPCLEIDMIELDPILRGYVKENFFVAEYRKYWSMYESAREDAEKDEALAMYRIVDKEYIKMRFVHEDFLDFNTMTQYDLIIMNPPFTDGDAHLLQAISLQERYGGQIRCILNAETLRNPYTNRRKILLQKLSQYKADISYLENAFKDAERASDVTVALIKLEIPSPHRESEIFSRLRKAEEVKQKENDPTQITVSDRVEAVVSQYRVEVKAGIEIIQEYIAMQPYILDSFDSERGSPMLGITVNSDHISRGILPNVNEYVRAVRRKYWSALFKNKAIFGQLTSNLQDELSGRVKEMENFEFDVYNIHILVSEMNAQMQRGVVETILELFEKMTVGYHWRDDPCVENIHYYNGWATNKAHFINKKVILPCYGVFPDYSWATDTFRVYEAYRKLEDIEKVLNYLDGERTAEVSLHGALERANAAGKTRNIQCKYFDVTFFKKGTMHIKWTNLELLDRFNIFCGRNKNWLPPSYGKKQYQDMTQEEKAVVDSFHGDNTSGSGKKAYDMVVAQANYFLAPPNHTTVSLPA